MTRVSPPDDAREFPAPQASMRVTRWPARRSDKAVHPPNAPAPTTTTWSLRERGNGAGAVRRRSVSALRASPAAIGVATAAVTNSRRETDFFSAGFIRDHRLWSFRVEG